MLRILILFFLLWPSLAWAASFQGLVVKVSDGDTVQVMHNGKAEKVRLAEIDCPEKDQPYGQAAKRLVLDLSAQKVVTVEVETTDRYGRTVGEVFLPDGSSLNRELVRAGYAWHYKRYSTDASLGVLEQEAHWAKRGLWKDKNPVPPWEWRRGKRTGVGRSDEPASGVTVYNGNVKSKVFHSPECKYYDCKNCTERLPNKQVALSAGYRECGICRP